MSELNSRAHAWLRQHHLTITDDHLASCGVTLDQRRLLVANGFLTRVLDGAYTPAGVPETTLLRCAALCTSRPRLVVCGPTAGWLWKLRRCPEPDTVHVLAPPARNPCREPWVRAYRTALIDPEDVVTRPDGIAVTSPPRTVVDLVRYLRPLDLLSATESALSSRVCTETALERVIDRLDTPGRPWVRRFRRLLSTRLPGGAADSGGEIDVGGALVAAGVPDLVRQHPLVLPGYGPARYDLAVPQLRWAAEVDLHPEHRSLEGEAKDNARDAAARAAGWAVCRLGALQLDRSRFASTIADVVAELARRRGEVEALRSAGLWTA